MPSADSALEALLRRDRAIVLASLTLVVVLSWLYIVGGAGMEMPAMSGDGQSMAGAMMTPAAWDAGYASLMLVMWWVMMVAMMLPSAAPMILLFTALNRRNGEGKALPLVAFVLAYVTAWGGFSLGAVALQWALERSGLLSPMMTTTSSILGGSLLVGAGIWQLSPLKHACLRHCRTPIHFFAHGWRPGASGAFRMGLEHGAFCLGCCWVLMALLFYGGVMNLWWIAGLALYVLVEKVVPAGHWIGRGTGSLLVLWGLWVLAAGS